MDCKFKIGKFAKTKCDGIISNVSTFQSEEVDIILSEIGLVKSVLTREYNVCDTHYVLIKEENRLSWVRGKCCVPDSIAIHKGITRGDRKISMDMMTRVLAVTGIVVPIGAPICTNCRKQLLKRKHNESDGTSSFASFSECAPNMLEIAQEQDRKLEEKRSRNNFVEE